MRSPPSGERVGNIPWEKNRTESLPSPNQSSVRKYASVCSLLDGLVMMSQGIRAPYHRRAARSFSA